MIVRNDYLALAKVYPVLSEISDYLQQRLMDDGVCFQAGHDKVLFEVGETCVGFVLVLSGSLRVIQPGYRREILLYRVLPGDTCILTVNCLLGEMSYQARGIVEENLTGVVLSAVMFRQLIIESSQFRAFIFRFFAERINCLIALIEDLAFTRVDQRLARLLLTKEAHIHQTHQQLADDLGSAREVISRYLKDFEARGLVQLERGSIHVTDRQALFDLANM